MLRVIRITLEKHQRPRRITCSHCGGASFEAGFAVAQEAVARGWKNGRERKTYVDKNAARHPLCNDCIRAMEQGES